MPDWFLIAIISPLLWSIVNHADKYLLSKSLITPGVGALLIFSCLFSLLLLPIILLFTEAPVLEMNSYDIHCLIVSGALNVVAFYFYLNTMEEVEASVVIPLLQLGPIFSYILAYIILGETLTRDQMLASMVILVGVIILSIDIDIAHSFKFRKRMLLTMAFAAFLFALSDTIFKKVTHTDIYGISTFWQYVGVSCTGIITLLAVPKFRNQFITMIRLNDQKILSINIGSETLYLLGNLANTFALLLVPVSLVSVVCSSQPLFVFIIGTLLTIFYPRIASEKVTRRHLIHKVISIGIIVAGSCWLIQPN